MNDPVAGAEDPGVLFLCDGSAEADLLGRSLPADRVLTSPVPHESVTWEWDWADALTAWQHEIASLPAAGRVVVCTWQEPSPSIPLIELDGPQWRRQVEWPTALWFSTLVAAAGRCCDGGSVVAVVERPAALDAIGQAPVIAVAEGVLNLVRSLAAHEGGRGVRVNAVITSQHTPVDGLAGAPPPLATFPGRIDVEVAGAVRTLLSSDSLAMTGTALHATCGRR